MSEHAVMTASSCITHLPDICLQHFEDTGWPDEVIILCRKELRLVYVWQLFRLIDRDFEIAHLDLEESKRIIDAQLAPHGLDLRRDLSREEHAELFNRTFGASCT
jgi:hypothetical protein